MNSLSLSHSSPNDSTAVNQAKISPLCAEKLLHMDFWSPTDVERRGGLPSKKLQLSVLICSSCFVNFFVKCAGYSNLFLRDTPLHLYNHASVRTKER